MLINFSLTSRTDESIKIKNDPNFKGKKASTLWILLKGVIGKITGLNIIKQ